MSNNIKVLISELANNPFDERLNFLLGEEYEAIGQNASAVSFYLRAAEYGHSRDLVYCALIKVGLCLQKQGERDWNVSNSFLQAIEQVPDRPEAYFHMSRFYEKTSTNWMECYTFAQMGLLHAYKEHNNLASSVEYSGPNSLIFQKAVSSWWIDRKEESIDTFLSLAFSKNLESTYRKSVLDNIKNLGIQLDKIAVILPVRDAGTGRAQRLIQCLNSWSKITEGLSDVHIILDEDDVHNFGYLQQDRESILVHVKPSNLTLMEKINSIGLDIANTYKYMIFIGDDIVFKTPWESRFIEYLSSVPAGLVYGNTLDLPDHIDWATHPCITTNMVRAVGFYGCPAVAHNFFDNFWSEVAKEIGHMKFMPDIIMDHRRTGWTPDAIYHKVTGLLESDRVKYQEYKETKFDEDLQKIKDYINAG